MQDSYSGSASHQNPEIQSRSPFEQPMSDTVKLSKFQRIGCLRRSIINGYTSDAPSCGEQKQVINYLIDIEHFDSASAETIISPSSSLKHVFETVWDHLSDYEKSVAFWLNYETSDNYWPHWDIYNRALLPHIQLSSGTPESIIGSLYQTVPDSQTEQKNSISKTCRSNQNHAINSEEHANHVASEYNYAESSCMENYFNTVQQAYVIINAMDAVYGDDANHTTALELLERLKLPTLLIHALILEYSWPNRFHMIWSSLSTEQKADFITEDWSQYDNYWPGLDIYNQKLSSIIVLPVSNTTDASSMHTAST
ncbi:hypothetical protein LZ023_14545 [Pseudomonas silvicola]|nr:hypothetical protein LZ023_14545 [Pseudomonas silvicola]